ncbi:Hypothetical Protein FCC1311_067132 [Hondaea fermentalgiana]|uniref:Uncharacterized protein n=1 Tax=Hondaea fermentalgiana TaxID=2315210 RepID=A0A2R5GPE5_9STRA|nr:Hypothetical Protein FCC1311_067132 [Hondaea fermentalgiana]|eukprot:GBG30493.1 Hypothetical Protein FCC1311_067132 [Hondaea fermentalgiana]
MQQTPRPPFVPPATYPGRKRRWRSQHEDVRLRFLDAGQREKWSKAHGANDTSQNPQADDGFAVNGGMMLPGQPEASAEDDDKPAEMTKMEADQWERVHWDVDFKERLKSATTCLRVPDMSREVETWDSITHAKFEMGCTDIANTLTRPLSLLYVPGELAAACVPKKDAAGNLISLKVTPANRSQNPRKRKAVNVLARIEAREAKGGPSARTDRKGSMDEAANEGDSSGGEEEQSDDDQGDYGAGIQVDDDDDDYNDMGEDEEENTL